MMLAKRPNLNDLNPGNATVLPKKEEISDVRPK